MSEPSISDFYDALLCEAVSGLRSMAEASRVQAQAIDAQASMVERLLDAARHYRGSAPQQADPNEVLRTLGRVETIVNRIDMNTFQSSRGFEGLDPSPTDEPTIVSTALNEGSVRRAKGQYSYGTHSGYEVTQEEAIQASFEAQAEFLTSGPGVFSDAAPDEPDWPAGSEKAQAEFEAWAKPVEPDAQAEPTVLVTDPPRYGVEGFADVPTEDLKAEALADVPKIEIVEKVLEPVDPDTAIDASGKLVPADPVPAFDVAGVLRQQEEELRQAQDEARERGEVVIDWGAVSADKPSPEPSPEPEPETVSETMVAEPEPEPEPEPAPKPKRSSPKKADDASEERPRDRVLNHYAKTGDSYLVMAEYFGINPNTVGPYLSTARAEGDKRVATGDLMRAEQEEAEEAKLRSDHIAEAKGKRDLVFFDDDQIGVPAYVVNYAGKKIETPHGDLGLSPSWLRIMDVLKDRDAHETIDVWQTAGRFANERHVLGKLRDINELLAGVKLYILAERKHYQLCGLL